MNGEQKLWFIRQDRTFLPVLPKAPRNPTLNGRFVSFNSGLPFCLLLRDLIRFVVLIFSCERSVRTTAGTHQLSQGILASRNRLDRVDCLIEGRRCMARKVELATPHRAGPFKKLIGHGDQRLMQLPARQNLTSGGSYRRKGQLLLPEDLLHEIVEKVFDEVLINIAEEIRVHDHGSVVELRLRPQVERHEAVAQFMHDMDPFVPLPADGEIHDPVEQIIEVMWAEYAFNREERHGRGVHCLADDASSGVCGGDLWPTVER